MIVFENKAFVVSRSIFGGWRIQFRDSGAVLRPTRQMGRKVLEVDAYLRGRDSAFDYAKNRVTLMTMLAGMAAGAFKEETQLFLYSSPPVAAMLVSQVTADAEAKMLAADLAGIDLH